MLLLDRVYWTLQAARCQQLLILEETRRDRGHQHLGALCHPGGPVGQDENLIRSLAATRRREVIGIGIGTSRADTVAVPAADDLSWIANRLNNIKVRIRS